MDKGQTYTIIWLIHHAFANGTVGDAYFQSCSVLGVFQNDLMVKDRKQSKYLFQYILDILIERAA